MFSQSESASSAFNIGDLLCVGFDFAQPDKIEYKKSVLNPCFRKANPRHPRSICAICFACASTPLSLTRLSIKNPFKSVFSQSESASSAFNISDLLCVGFDFAQPDKIKYKKSVLIRVFAKRIRVIRV